MKRLALGLAMSLCVSTLCLSTTVLADGPALRIATEGAYPPFNLTKPDGQVGGLEVELANALCERMKRTCTIVTQDWDGIIPGLMTRKYDAIMATMNITQERAKAIAFSVPYMVVPAYFVAATNSGIDGTLQTLKGKTVGAQTSTTHYRYVEKHLGDAVTLRSYDTAGNLLADLKSGRVDAAITTGATATDWVKVDAAKTLALAGKPLVDQDVFGPGVGVGLRKEDTELKASFDAAIASVVQDGTLARIAAKYVDFSVTP